MLRASFLVAIVSAFLFSLFSFPVLAGFVDSMTKSVESSGNYVERKSGSRSDSKKYPVYRREKPGVKIQLPGTYKVKADKKMLKATRKGVSMKLNFAPMAQQAGLDRYKKEKSEAKKSYKAGKLVRVNEKQIDQIPGVETTQVKGERDGPRTITWRGYDSTRKRYITLTAKFDAKQFNTHAADFEAAKKSIRWDYKK